MVPVSPNGGSKKQILRITWKTNYPDPDFVTGRHQIPDPLIMNDCKPDMTKQEKASAYFAGVVQKKLRVSELAALACWMPFLTFHRDKVILRPSPTFFPKVVSSFHLNEDIVLPSFCPPTHHVEKALHSLDLVRALRKCVSRMAPFRQTEVLFVLPAGHRKGLPASKSTIARWIRSTIQEAYRVRGKPISAGLGAHSTRLCQPPSGSSIHPRSCVPNEWLGVKDFTIFLRHKMNKKQQFSNFCFACSLAVNDKTDLFGGSGPDPKWPRGCIRVRQGGGLPNACSDQALGYGAHTAKYCGSVIYLPAAPSSSASSALTLRQRARTNHVTAPSDLSDTAEDVEDGAAGTRSRLPAPIQGFWMVYDLSLGTTMICLTSGYECITRQLLTTIRSPSPALLCSKVDSHITDTVSNVLEDMKGPFENHIRNILLRTSANPLLLNSSTKDSSPPPEECLQLLSRATQVFREEYILKQDMAREEIQRRVKLLITQKEKQRKDLQYRKEERKSLKETAERLAEKYEEAKEKQDDLLSRLKAVLHSFNTRHPVLTESERDMKKELLSTHEQLHHLDNAIKQVKMKMDYQERKMDKVKSPRKSNLNLSDYQQKNIQTVLKEQ
ncbi:unnamed protein product [Ranitomeya imitator]|uniref:Uncharacterized protein n=1 Tax=Ranitomeya imitator TaxID=111125 RepID=A0ABN9LMQ1_9NEOB|nr:unnamed protein product [Ranitomeya imitator]